MANKKFDFPEPAFDLKQLNVQQAPVVLQATTHQTVELSDASIQKLVTALSSAQRIRTSKPLATLTEGFLEIFSSLVALQQVETLSQILNLTLPGNASVSIVIPAPMNKVILTSEALFTVAADNQFSVTVIIDSEVKYSDPSMLALRYNNNPLKFMALGSFYPSKASITIQLANITSNPASIGGWIVGGIFPRDLWDEIIQLYFKSLLKELGLSGQY